VVGSQRFPLAPVLFLASLAVTMFGAAMGVLEYTYIATTSDLSQGATRTSGLMILLLLCSAMTVPHVPGWAARLGSQRLYWFTDLATAVIWAISGIALLAGAPPFLTLVLITPLMGIATGITAVLAPLFGKAFLSGESMAGAYARMSVIMGLSWAAGSLVGGQFLQDSRPGLGFIVRAVTALPLVVVLAIVTPPGGAPAPKPKTAGAWKTLADRIRQPGALRTALLIPVASVVFTIPFLTLIMPITAALRQVPLVTGAGILMASTSIGEIASPAIVGALQKRWAALTASAIAALACGSCLLVFALISASTSDRPELMLWSLVGLVFGAARYSGKALEIDAAVNAGVEETEAMATISFTKTAMAPVGLIVWAGLIQYVSVEAALLVGFIGMTICATAILRSYQRSERLLTSVS